ncbi:DNA repair protein RecN [Apibacter mensalis]|uniref:DNA repair protein RecN n=1 Tax=Apibacter mensalis TaxID=1586267 RepID=UPI0026F3003E|nr:DNA repair protein RecN [Apibacter mensalis]
MLSHLSIRNYALIDILDIDFPSGMITVTGETGAGKSIILGALKLVLGERADYKSLKNADEKCFVEAEFTLDRELFSDFFIQNELDFDSITIIRREILPSGKSRAFINDTPVTLSVLHSLTEKLIDIHSQFDTSDLMNEKYQLHILDNYSDAISDLKEYQKAYQKYVFENSRLTSLKKKLLSGNEEVDYKNYLLEELITAQLDSINFVEMENELNLLKNSEYLAQILTEVKQILDNDEIGILNQLREVSSRMDKGSQYSTDLMKLSERISSVKLELQDISAESEFFLEKLDFSPLRYEELTQKVDLIHSLYAKHKVTTIEELKQIRESLSKDTSDLMNLENQIQACQDTIKTLSSELTKWAQDLHTKRKTHVPELENKILTILSHLGMEKSKIEISIQKTDQFTANGTDIVNILFSANAGMSLQPIAKAISGGERSRVMLAIKKIMSEKEALPTLILDEIDTGVSGRIANEMGKLMQQMASTMQLIAITHLPQVAAKGNSQFKVEKTEKSGETQTQICLLNHEERIEEIAQLISGSDITENARKQAIELLK